MRVFCICSYLLLLTLHLGQYGATRLTSAIDPETSQSASRRPSKRMTLASAEANLTNYRFTGATDQYLKFRVWDMDVGRFTPGRNALPSISFRFRTKQANAMLLYLDNSGGTDCIALTLTEGAVRLRFKFGTAPSVSLEAGSNLNDSRWHRVALRRRQFTLILTVDGHSTKGTVRGEGRSDFVPISYTYFGGLPVSSRLHSLSLPSILYKNKFIGDMRAISMNYVLISRVEKEGVVEELPNRLCSRQRNPCQNKGRCHVRQREAICDCTKTSFTGKFCDKTYYDAVASFRGSGWLSYDLTRDPLSSYDDEITLSFKTRHSNGLLLHTGKSADYVTLAIKDGYVLLVVNLGSGAYEIVVEPKQGRFNDGKWHTIRVNRTLRELLVYGQYLKIRSCHDKYTFDGRLDNARLYNHMSGMLGVRVNIVVDQVRIYNNYQQEDFTQLTLDDVFYVGGSPSTGNLPGTKIKNNFIGCLKEVSYSNTEPRLLAISRLAVERDLLVNVNGDVRFNCDEQRNGPISFLSPNAILNIPVWQNKRRGMIEFKFLTTEENGVLVHAPSRDGDFFVIEIFEGSLFIVFNLGSGTSSFRFDSLATLSDGEWHQISVQRFERNVTITLDGVSNAYKIRGANSALNTLGPMYLGGGNFESKFQFYRGFKNAPLRKGFVGCVRDLRLDGVNINLQSLVNSPDPSSRVSSNELVSYCKSLGGLRCGSNPCLNGGICKERMNRFVCDCSTTSFTGETCNQAVVTTSYDGNQAMTFPMERTVQTDSEVLTLRFKTLISTGLLFATTSNTTRDSLVVQLIKGGKVQMYLNIGRGPDVLVTGKNLNDGRWHRVRVARRGFRVTLSVDDQQISDNIAGRHYNLEFDVIHLGKIFSSSVQSRIDSPPNRSRSATSSYPPPFAGHLQNVLFNSIPLIDSCLDKALYCRSNATVGNADYVTAFPITFQDDISYVTLPTPQPFNTLTATLSMKTTVRNGLILYSAGNNGYYIAVELVEGRLYYVSDIGNGAQVLSVSSANLVNDNQWHNLKLTRDESNYHVMTVDGMNTSWQGRRQSQNVNFTGNLFIGGVPQRLLYDDAFPRDIGSRNGFQGCLANIDWNGQLVDLTTSLSRRLYAGTVRKGCQAPVEPCAAGVCRNGGVCSPKWNDFVCDCSMTTYVGERCDQHVNTLPAGVTYQFGLDMGIILYEWLDYYPSPREDSFSVGFSSSQQGALLIRVIGNLNKNKLNFLELAIVKGRLTLTFNMGSNNVTLVEPRPVSDGQYHKCVVHRKWMNATLQVDNWPERSSPGSNGATRNRFDRVQGLIPASARPTVDEWLRRKERTNTVFSSQSMIQIGGLVDRSAIARYKSGVDPSPRIRRPFQGQMSSFFFNDVRVFDLALDGDPQVTMIGSVTRFGNEPSPPTRSSPLSPTTTMATETVFTTAQTSVGPPLGPGCNDVDLCENSSGASMEGSAVGEKKTPPLPDSVTTVGFNNVNEEVDKMINKEDPSVFIPVTSGRVKLEKEPLATSAFSARPDRLLTSVPRASAFPVAATSGSQIAIAFGQSTYISPTNIFAGRAAGTKKNKSSASMVGQWDPKPTALPPHVSRAVFAENQTSSVPTVVEAAASLSLLMIAGIAAAGGTFLLILILIIYRCRSRDTVYDVNKEERKHEAAAAKHIVVNANGTIVKETAATANKRDANKEVFV